MFDLNEFISEVLRALRDHEIDPEPPYRFYTGCGYGEEGRYCKACIHELHPGAVLGAAYTAADPVHSASLACDKCGVCLRYALNDAGVDVELHDYSDREYPFDWDNPRECFEVNRIGKDVSNARQRGMFLELILKSVNMPYELQHRVSYKALQELKP